MGELKEAREKCTNMEVKWLKLFSLSSQRSTRFYFYSYDTRGSHAGTPSHWKDEEILENRAIFRTVRSPAELVIKPVKVCFQFFTLSLTKKPTTQIVLSTEIFSSRSKTLSIFHFHSFAFYSFRRKTPAIFDAALTLNFLQQGTVMWTFKL